MLSVSNRVLRNISPEPLKSQGRTRNLCRRIFEHLYDNRDTIFHPTKTGCPGKIPPIATSFFMLAVFFMRLGHLLDTFAWPLQHLSGPMRFSGGFGGFFGTCGLA